MKKAISIIVFSIVLLIVIISVSFSSKHIEIYGNDVSITTEAIGFSGEELDTVDSIINNLARLPNLKIISLGSFPVHISETQKLQDAFDGIELSYRTYVVMYGDVYFTDVEKLDFSSKNIEDISALETNLPYMEKLDSIIFNNQNTISFEKKAELEQTYSNVEFNIVPTYNIYGINIREDVEKIDLSKSKVDDKLKEYLSLFPNLIEVDLHNAKLSLDQKKDLINTFPNIFFGWKLELLGEEYESSVESIDLSYKYMVSSIDQLKEEIKMFTKLKFLDMSYCSVDNETMAKLRDELNPIKVVWRIYLGTRWSLRSDQVCFSVLIYTYNYRQMTTEDIQVLKYCTELQALDLGHQDISDISVIGDYLPNLRILILADNNITDLSPLAKLKHLHYLEFFVNSVTDLTPLASCEQLVDLNISYNHSLSDITPILNLPKLERLWLEHCNVSYEDVQKLNEAYPNATIISEGKGSIDQGWRTHDRYYAMIDMFMYNQFSVFEEFSKYD